MYGNERCQNRPPPAYGFETPSPRTNEPVVMIIAYFAPGVTATGAARSMCCSPAPCASGPTLATSWLVAKFLSWTVAVPAFWK